MSCRLPDNTILSLIITVFSHYSYFSTFHFFILELLSLAFEPCHAERDSLSIFEGVGFLAVVIGMALKNASLKIPTKFQSDMVITIIFKLHMADLRTRL